MNALMTAKGTGTLFSIFELLGAKNWQRSNHKNNVPIIIPTSLVSRANLTGG
tara:strand:- start:8454 stop:8609 length:156 start_codon:yes stop_codon:yes gene_type:complete